MVCLSWLISDWRRHSVSVYKKRYHLPYWACNHFHQLLSHRAFSTPGILFTGRFILGFARHMQACTVRLWHRTLVNGNMGWLRHISVSPTHKRNVCPRWQQETPMQYCSYTYSCWNLNLFMACFALTRNTVHGLGTKSGWIKALLLMLPAGSPANHNSQKVILSNSENSAVQLTINTLMRGAKSDELGAKSDGTISPFVLILSRELHFSSSNSCSWRRCPLNLSARVFFLSDTFGIENRTSVNESAGRAKNVRRRRGRRRETEWWRQICVHIKEDD